MKFRKSWPVLAICAFYIYLAFHALSGSQGLMSWVDYEADIERHSEDLEGIKLIKSELEFQVEALRAQDLNRDLLDMKARRAVYYSHPNEITIWLDP